MLFVDYLPGIKHIVHSISFTLEHLHDFKGQRQLVFTELFFLYFTATNDWVGSYKWFLSKRMWTKWQKTLKSWPKTPWRPLTYAPHSLSFSTYQLNDIKESRRIETTKWKKPGITNEFLKKHWLRELHDQEHL